MTRPSSIWLSRSRRRREAAVHSRGYSGPLPEHIALVAEALGVLVIVVGLVRTAWEYIRSFPHEQHEHEQIGIRLHLGKSLSLALELLLAADILLTAVAPSWNALDQLAAVIALRTLLNYFLHREMSREEDKLRRSEQRETGR